MNGNEETPKAFDLKSAMKDLEKNHATLEARRMAQRAENEARRAAEYANETEAESDARMNE